MKIRQGLVLREVAGSYVVIDLGGALDFKGMLTLNETGAFIWRAFENGKTAEETANLLADEYEISPEDALSDVNRFLSKMKSAGVFE